MYNVQVLIGKSWRNLLGYQPMDWDKSLDLFIHYMNTFQERDYRIKPVVALPTINHG